MEDGQSALHITRISGDDFSRIPTMNLFVYMRTNCSRDHSTWAGGNGHPIFSVHLLWPVAVHLTLSSYSIKSRLERTIDFHGGILGADDLHLGAFGEVALTVHD